jgi:hypothetical protein
MLAQQAIITSGFILLVLNIGPKKLDCEIYAGHLSVSKILIPLPFSSSYKFVLFD